MSEPTSGRPQQERRHGDRRSEPAETRRAPQRSRWGRWIGIAGRDIAIIVIAVAAIVFTVRHMHPIYEDQPTVAASIEHKAPVAKAVLQTPADTSQLAQITSSPKFEEDRKKFAAALVATGRMSQARADSISYYAVRESYVQGVPPAVVFGVMLTENAMFVSNAMSNVGAVGLMQVYPKVWLKALSKKFGKDLAVDSTNLKYGIYILKSYLKNDSTGAVSQATLSKGLLHYNGCVTGSNTPTCHNYPTKVKTYVEKSGGSLCEGQSFYQCIGRPFLAGFFGNRSPEVLGTQ
jgi:hypothetical protein